MRSTRRDSAPETAWDPNVPIDHSADDAGFFMQHPVRVFRVRRMGKFEYEHFTALARRSPEGLFGYVAVRRLAPGLRARIPFWTVDLIDEEQAHDEAFARRTFLTIMPSRRAPGGLQ